jgi:hypothetical protein
MAADSVLFFGLYALAVVVFHRGLKPITDTIGLLHDLLPARPPEVKVSAAVDA